MRTSLLFPALIGLAGCQVQPAEDPGEALGTFTVIATISTNSCGTGAFDAPSVQELSVKLNRDGSTLYWIEGDSAQTGALASDEETFSFTGSTSAQLGEQASCQVTRTEQKTGTLVGEPAAVTGLKGTLRYRYDPVAGADCSLLEPGAQIPLTLPCELVYELKGTPAK